MTEFIKYMLRVYRNMGMCLLILSGMYRGAAEEGCHSIKPTSSQALFIYILPSLISPSHSLKIPERKTVHF